MSDRTLDPGAPPPPHPAEVAAIASLLREQAKGLRLTVETGYSSPGIYRGTADRLDEIADRVEKLAP